MSAPTFIYPPPTSGGTPVGGSGTVGTIPVWGPTTTTLTDSQLIQSATAIYTTTRNFGVGATAASWNTAIRVLDMRTSAIWNFNSGSDSVAYWTVNALTDTSGNVVYKATSAASQYTQIGGAHVWSRAVAGTAGGACSFLESARIDVAGNVILNAANTGATIQAAGSQQGLKLPSTPGATGAGTEQILDCYNEVTNWVPTVTFGTGGTVSYTVHTGYYVRVGRLVTFALRVDFTVTAAPTGGDLQITLPVASAVDQYFGSGNFNSLPGSGTQGPLYVSVGVSSTANIRKASATGGSSIASAITASSTFIVTGTYIS